MSLDFLRYLAFDGELTNFFRDDIYEFGSRATGVHLRFNPDFLESVAGHFYERNRNENNWYLRRDFGYYLNQVLSSWRERDWDRTRRYDIWDFGSDSRWGVERRKIVQILVDVASGQDTLLTDGPREYEGFPIVYRVFGPIEPQYAPGASISAVGGGRGTLCGFLRHANRTFALTCGHVVKNLGVPVVDTGGKLPLLGTVNHVKIPSGQGNCNRYAQPVANGLDVALVEIGASVALTPGHTRIVEPISAIQDGDYVEFLGQGSRRPGLARVMNATIWKQIDLFSDGKLYCCGDIFEISHRSTPYVNSPLSKKGDSGAAVTKADAPGQWLGMLIGGHRSSSFVCYAEHIMDWAESLIGGVAPHP